MNDHIKINLEAFQTLNKELIEKNNLKYALLHNGILIDTYNDLDDAYKVGKKLYPENDFFIRQINAPSMSYGFFNDRIITV